MIIVTPAGRTRASCRGHGTLTPAGTDGRSRATKSLEWRAHSCSTVSVARHAQALIASGLLGLVWVPLSAEVAQIPDPGVKPLPSPAEQLEEVIVQTTEPRFVSPTRRDRIGRIWAPVMIDGKGPYRLVLDTGATRSAVTTRAAQSLGNPEISSTTVTGFTGSAVVPTIHVDHMEVGDLYVGPSNLPVLSDVFGGAQGVLGIEGLENKRIYADFTRDRLEITLSHGERARRDFTVVPVREVNGLLVADVRVGTVRTMAIVDTGAQGTVGNLALRDALMRRVPGTAKREEVIGVTLDVQSGDTVAAPTIDFGESLKVRGVRVTFGDMYVFRHWKLADRPAMTLGMDLLGSFDVLVIDYGRHELQIRPRDVDLSPVGFGY
jgi:predicted aspartyl protease